MPSTHLPGGGHLQTHTIGNGRFFPDPSLPLGAPFPWIGHIHPSPTASAPMIAGCITPAIMQEALRRTPCHKAAGPDGVPRLILKHMLQAFYDALHLLFQSMAITGITPPSWLKSHTILLYKKGTPLNWTTSVRSHWPMPCINYGPHAWSLWQ